MTEIHRAVYDGHVGIYSTISGRVRFGNKIFQNINEAIRYFKNGK